MPAVQHPVISVRLDPDDGLYHLYASSYGFTSPAGSALFRARPHPIIRFSHESRQAAEKDAQSLRDYIRDAWGKRISKAKQRKHGDSNVEHHAD